VVEFGTTLVNLKLPGGLNEPLGLLLIIAGDRPLWAFCSDLSACISKDAMGFLTLH
jgi:hypothetical protein